MTALPELVAALLALSVLVWPSGSPETMDGSANSAPDADDDVDGDNPQGLTTWGRRAHRAACDAHVSDGADALALLALVLKTGCSMPQALHAVSEVTQGQVRADLRVVLAAHAWGSPPGTEWERVGDQWREASLAWTASSRAGAAPAGLLEAASQRMRAREQERIETQVQRAGVLLVLPLGICFLPGFLCTSVIPVVRHLASGLLGGMS